MLSALVRRDRPDLLAGVQPAAEAGLAAAVNAMNDLTGLADGVARCGTPATLWVGEADLYHDAARRFAEANGIGFISLPGDHISALEQHGAEAARQVAAFIEAATTISSAPRRQT